MAALSRSFESVLIWFFVLRLPQVRLWPRWRVLGIEMVNARALSLDLTQARSTSLASRILDELCAALFMAA